MSTSIFSARLARWLPFALMAVSALLLLHHGAEVIAVLRHGAGRAALTLDFRTYLCGAGDLTAPYDICHDAEYVSGFVYPPPALIYFHLLSRLTIDTAFTIHLLVCLAGLGAASWLLLRMVAVPRRAGVVALLAALAIAPIGTSLAAGQVNILLMTSAVAGIWFAGRNRPGLAGLSIALGFWLKIYPGLVPVLFLTRERWRSAAATIAAAGLIALLGLIWASPSLYAQYVLQVLPHAQGYTMPGVAHSLAGMAAHVQAGGGRPVQHFVPIGEGVQLASRRLPALGLLAAFLHGVVTRGKRPLDSLNLLLCVTLVAAPNAWGYHYAMILPAIFAALARELAAPRRWGLPLVLGCWLALVIPAWSDLPHPLAGVALLNVAFHGRYALVALALAGAILAEAAREAASTLARRGDMAGLSFTAP